MASSPHVVEPLRTVTVGQPNPEPAERPAAPEEAPGVVGARFEWGVSGARMLASTSAVVVTVDVLSFTTSVSVAARRGIAVYPCPDAESGRRLSGTTGAPLAVGRHETGAGHPWSLSPADVAEAPYAPSIVLPSPNGAAVAAAVAAGGVPVVAACLRNISSVVAYLLDGGFGRAERAVAVVAAGERWADASLRPAIEDLFGAGLVLSALADAGCRLSPEATVAVRSVTGLSSAQIADLVGASTSGSELKVAGYGADVALAVEMDADGVVPLLRGDGGAFRDETAGGATG